MNTPAPLRRDPVVTVELVTGVLLAVIALVPFTPAVGTAANAVVVAAAGLVVLRWLPHWRDQFLPALTGLIKALFALWLGYGLTLPDATQAGILGVVSAAVALFVRSSVDPIDAKHPSPQPSGLVLPPGGTAQYT